MRRWRIATITASLAISCVVAACGSTTPRTTPSATSPGTTATSPTSFATPAGPTSVSAILQKAIGEQNRKQYAQAIADFLSVVKTDPGNEVAWYDLGVIANLHDQTAEAVRDYQNSLNGDAGYVPALYNLAVLDAVVHPKVAVKLYEHVLRLQPGNSDAHLNLGFALESIGQARQAKAQFAQAIKLAPPLAARVPVADGGTA